MKTVQVISQDSLLLLKKASTKTTTRNSQTVSHGSGNVYANMFAGALGGFLADAVCHPIDTIKARLQANQTSSMSFSCFGGPWSSSSSGIHRRIPSSFIKWHHILKHNPLFTNLYSGIGAVLIGTIPSSALQFSVFKAAQHHITKRIGGVGETGNNSGGCTIEGAEMNRALIDMTAGSIAELFSLITYVPSEVVAKRMQVHGTSALESSAETTKSKSVPGIFLNIIREEGIRGLYTGWLPTVYRNVPFAAFQFMFYEQFKVAWEKHISAGGSHGIGDISHQANIVSHLHRSSSSATLRASTEKSDYLVHIFLGFLAGAFASILTNPFDLVKTRQQVFHNSELRNGSGVHDATKPRAESCMVMLSNVVKNEGVRGLFKGTIARVLWVAPASAISLSVFDGASQWYMTHIGDETNSFIEQDTTL